MPSYSIIELQGVEIVQGAKNKKSVAGIDLGFFQNVDDKRFDILRKSLSGHAYVTSREVTSGQMHDCLIFSKFELKKQFATWLPKSNNQLKSNSMILASIMSDGGHETLVLNIHLDSPNDHISPHQVQIIDRLIEGYGLPFIIHLGVQNSDSCNNSPNLSKSQKLGNPQGSPAITYFSQNIEIRKEVFYE